MSTKPVLTALLALIASPVYPRAMSQASPASVDRSSMNDRVSRKQQADRERMVTLLAILDSPVLPPVIVQEPSSPPPAVHKAAPARAAHRENEGERIFQQNCNRCHNAPEGFSPRISGTIVRHMRVRASLSKHDEEELLRFFNP